MMSSRLRNDKKCVSYDTKLSSYPLGKLMRHNVVVKHLSDACNKVRYRVHVEPSFHTNVILRKTDLIVVNGDCAYRSFAETTA